MVVRVAMVAVAVTRSVISREEVKPVGASSVTECQ